MIKRNSIFLILFTFGFSFLSALSFVVEETITLNPQIDAYTLSHKNIVSLSESVFGDSLRYAKNLDYTIDYQKGILKLIKKFPTTQIHISYLIIPPELTTKHTTYERIAFSDSIPTFGGRTPTNWMSSNSNLNINGSKTFSLSFSETGDAELLQSLYVDLNGQLAKDVYINAQLSDSQSKLSPEGDSKELSSLDQVFIRVYGKKWELGMGDLELSYENSRYLNYNTKLEGIAAKYSSEHEFSAAFSAGSAKKAFMNLDIVDGKQGPYYLSANDNQRSFIVVAGTEEIYLDGIRLERGTDYYIDYSEGSVMFRRIVSSLNSVNVWFQYSDENYRQSTYYNSSKITISNKLSLRHHLIHQADAKNNPLLFSFSETDLDSLATAGDATVYTNGAIETEPGTGTYRQVENADGNIYYEYAPEDSTAIYNIMFSFVGQGNGDYTEYSIGRYHYVGSKMGAWLPLKTIIAPTKRSNIELSLLYEGDSIQTGIDALYSNNDANTHSSKDDNDNSAGIVSLWMAFNHPDNPFKAKIDTAYRLSNTYRFSNDGAPEHDFAVLPDVDSLAMANVDFSLAWQGSFFEPKLLLRYRDLKDNYIQKAIRFSSDNPNSGWIPYLRLHSTISEQSGNENSLMMYQNAELGWQYGLMGLNFAALYSALEDDNPSFGGTRLFRWQPSVDLKSARSFTSVTFSEDTNSIKRQSWQKANSQQTYTLKHSSNYQDHRVDFDMSHRIIKNPSSDNQPKTNYDLLNFRSGHTILKGAVDVFSNYQLNQTEFYPKIRELIWVGHGQGIYDSTGVIVDDGEFIYEYVTSPIGRLSTDISGTASIYLKPGQYFKNPLWQKIQTDITLSANEQGEQGGKWQSYLFFPDYSYNTDTIYGRRSFFQNLWLNLYEGKILSNISLEHSRSKDQRYQITEQSWDNKQQLQLDFRNFWNLNTRFGLNHENSKESRYSSDIDLWRGSVLAEKIINTQSTLQIDSGYISEKGKQQGAENSYHLQNIYLSPSLRSIFLQKYRISAKVNIAYNFREGSAYLLFLPQKREGFLTDANISIRYRINDFSSFSLDYRFGKYPQNKSTHNLKLEFKAEL